MRETLAANQILAHDPGGGGEAPWMESPLSKRVMRRVTSGASKILYRCLPTLRTTSTPD